MWCACATRDESLLYKHYQTPYNLISHHGIEIGAKQNSYRVTKISAY
jgi:hypothetical protein